MSTSNNPEESLTLLELLEVARSFPAFVEVDQDLRNVNSVNKLKPGTLLWLLRRCQDEASGKDAVRAATVDASTVEFPLVLEDAIMVFHRKYYEVAKRMNQSFGPTIDIGTLANLALPECPVFAVSGDDQDRQESRILIHGKQRIQGYLARGQNVWLVIPGEFPGTFFKKTCVSNIIYH